MPATTPHLELRRTVGIGLVLATAVVLSVACADNPVELSTGPTATIVEPPTPTMASTSTTVLQTPVTTATTPPTNPPLALGAITTETVVLVTAEGKVELVDRTTLARRLIYSPASPSERALSAAIDRTPGRATMVYASIFSPQDAFELFASMRTATRLTT